MNLTTDIHLAQKLIIHGGVLPLTHTHSTGYAFMAWYLFKNRDKCNFPTAMKIQVVVFWAWAPCGDVRYQHFEGPCCLHLQDEAGLLGSHVVS
jgi:hypothetical protein